MKPTILTILKYKYFILTIVFLVANNEDIRIREVNLFCLKLYIWSVAKSGFELIPAWL